jgi:hypothetical protein
MDHGLVCWKCGASLAHLTLPVERRDECKQCRAELHACRMCVDYDTSLAKRCREPTAEEVYDKTKANFCGYYTPRPGAFVAQDQSPAELAKAALEAMFRNS